MMTLRPTVRVSTQSHLIMFWGLTQLNWWGGTTMALASFIGYVRTRGMPPGERMDTSVFMPISAD